MLSEMQAENQQRLKDREQELKDMKKVMEVMKVGLQNFVIVGLLQISRNKIYISHIPLLRHDHLIFFPAFCR